MSDELLRRIRDEGASRSDAPAVRAGGVCVSYAALVDRIQDAASRLDALGLRSGDTIGLQCTGGVDDLVVLLAALDRGIAYVPFDSDLPSARRAHIIEQATLAAVIDPGAFDAAPHRVAHRASASASTAVPPSASTQAEQIAYVLYTSGSTGAPKGVMVSRRGLTNYLAWCAEEYGRTAWECALVGSSFTVDLTITGLLGPLWIGRCVELLSGPSPIDRLCDGLRDASGRCLIKATPTQIMLMLPRLTPALASKVALLVVGGEPLPWHLVRHWRRLAPDTIIVNEYGPTETVVGCTAQRAGAEGASEVCVPIGAPIAGTRAYVMSPSLEPCGPGEIGELWIGGEGVAHGYLAQAGPTAHRFVPDPSASAAGARVYRTGDMVRWTDAGTLEFLGRTDGQVKVRGHRVELAEVEAALLGLSGIAAAAVVLESYLEAGADAGAGDDADEGDLRRFTRATPAESRLVAYVVGAEAAAAPTFAAVRERLGGRLPAYMLPSVIVLVPRLPLLPSGKVDRRALTRGLGRELSPSARADAPRTPLEAALCDILRDELGLASVGIHDNFFALGGDSIRVIGIHGRARDLGLALELADFFTHQTVAALAAHADRSAWPPAPARPAGADLIATEDRAQLPEGVEDAYPLAMMQAALIFHSQDVPGSANYHDVFVYRLGSRFDEQALRTVCAEVVRRHPVLRTSFALTGYRQPLQLVWRSAVMDVATHDLRGLPATEQEAALNAWIAQESHRSFDVAAAPLLRLHLHRVADDEAHWAFSFHDAILDGWSLATLLVELLQRYAAALTDTGVPAPPLATTYRDFVERERAVLRDEETRRFWGEYLSGRATPVPPQAGPATAVRGHIVEVSIAPELSDDLQAVARMLHVPVKHVLLAAHLHVTGAISGETDVVTGLESHGRLEAADGDRVLGMHLNTVPFRVGLPGGTWSDLIAEAYDTERRLLPHRRYPYAAIFKEHAGASFYTTVFNYTHFHVLREIEAVPGIEPLGGRGFGQRHYALSAEFNQDPYSNRLRLDLECNLDAHGEAYWRMVKDCYERALHAIAADPMGRYDLVGAEAPEAPGPTAAVAAPSRAAVGVLAQWLEQVERAPETIAVLQGDRRVTYRELHDRAQDIARQLRASGPMTDRRVGIYLEPGPEQMAAVWGVLMSGGAYVPIDADTPLTRVAWILAHVGAHAAITSPALHETLHAAELQLDDVQWCLLDPSQRPPEAAAPLPLPAMHPEQLAYVMYTSGSTGLPKGVQVTHANLAHSNAVRQAYYDRSAGTFLLIPSLSYDSAVATIYWTLCTGGTLVIPARGETRDPERLAALIAQHRVTTWLSVPALYEAVLRRATPAALASLRCVIVAGEQCPARLAASSRACCPADLFNEYGPTEATVWATVHEAGPDTSGAALPIGEAIDGARVYLLDARQQPVAPGVAGEIYIGGQGVSRGYTAAAITARRFLPDPFAGTAGARMYRTGDLARRLPDGGLAFVGRLDRQVKVRGYRVEPGEIEDVIRADADVRDVAVVPIAQESGHRLVAYIVAAGEPPTVAALRRRCALRLPAPLIPGTFVFVDALPRSVQGKIDTRYLAEIQPGLHDAEAIERLLARVEGMVPDEVDQLLVELAGDRPA